MSDWKPVDPEHHDYLGSSFFDSDPGEQDVSAPVESALSDHVLELEPEPADAASPVAETPELAQVGRMARALSKAVKAVQMYPLTNPMSRQFADEFVSRMNETFQTMDVIRLSVGKTKFFFSGETVLEQPGREESVPGRLFWSGIREVSFHVGIALPEVLEFLSLYRTSALRGEDGEDDFVTLLWEGTFQHITHIAIDDLIDLENENDPIPEEFGSDFMNHLDLEMHDLDDDEEIQRQANEMADQIRAKINDDDASLFGITNDERDLLMTEIAEEESPKMLNDIVRIIGETLFLEHDEESFVGLVQILSGALLGLIGEGRLEEASEVLSMLRELRETREDLTPAMATVLESGVTSAWDKTRRDILRSHLDTGQGTALETLDKFVGAMPAVAVEPMIDVLGNLENPRARRRLTTALSAKAAEDLTPLLPFLKDNRPHLVCTVAALLGETKSPQAVIPLKDLLKHREFRVRRAGLSALCTIGKGHAMDVASEALFDRDPRIRMAAARSLGMAGRNALPVLLTVVEEPDFDERPLTEKRSFYEALGYAGGNEVLPLMQEALKRKNIFRRGQSDEIRACACEALGWIGGTEARQLLSAHLNDRSVLVRTAAQSGLRRISEGVNREPLIKDAA